MTSQSNLPRRNTIILYNLQDFKENREKGFTLIELLVVILIIGILSAIAIPAFMNQRKAASTASLQSDLKNTAMTVQTWLSKPSNNPDKLKVELKGKTSGLVEGENAVNAFPEGMFMWNDSDSLPKISVSEGTSLEIPMLNWFDANWTDKHEPGEFCIKGTNAGSPYDAILYGDTPAEHDRSLYYDVRAGGVKNMEDLVKKIQNGESISCTGYVNRFIAAQSA